MATAPILIKDREKDSGNWGPCITIRPADPGKVSMRRQNLIDALQAGKKQEFLDEYGLDEKEISKFNSAHMASQPKRRRQ